MPEPAERIRRWLERVVVGLDLCPFARGPLEAGRVRIAVSSAVDLSEALADLGREIERLQRANPADLETTLVVFPRTFTDFESFVDGTHLARELLEAMGASGEVQIADFHPDYLFAGVSADDPANATSRAPHPVWHLLRESSVGRAADSHPDIHGIPGRNQALLREMDPAILAEMLR